MTAARAIPSLAHATQERQRAQATALEHLEARGRLVVESGVTGTDPLDVAARDLYLALEAERMLAPKPAPSARPERTFEGRRTPRGAIEITSDGGRFVAIVADAPAAARELLGRTFGRVPAELSPVHLARDFPQFDAPTWSITEAQVRAWAEGQA